MERRLIRTMLAGCAYGAHFGTKRERSAAVDRWLTAATIIADSQQLAANRPSHG